MQRLFKFLPALLLLFVLAACGGSTNTTGNTTTGGGNSARANLKFYVITHGQASDPFWSVVKKGVDQAAKDMGVQVVYEAPPTFDMVAMSHLIDAAVAAHPDGLVVSIPDPNALGPSIRSAVSAGIPVISINSGADVAKSLGVLVHVGQTEYQAGLGGGQKMAAAGVKHALCVNQEVGNAALEQRCKGFTDAMKQAGGTVKEIGVNLNNPTQTQQTIEAAIQHDSSIDGILTLGPTGASPALKALQDLNKTSSVKLATFDLSSDVLQAIKNGTMLFAIDQQQYLQGYLPIVLLTLYRTNLNTVANDVIQTGPGFVTKDNVDRVIQLTAQGTR
ncbi:MAG TPA: sugar ABC transporter substrate-binding protein [Ktedonobacteraceae bacterium]|jgi:simple sugar transport system substrate-binding protein|nr:sugar ABC transporter substrate-binding protein [Ktedonobacteraceae bacterium]